MTDFSVAMSVYRNDDPECFRVALESVMVRQSVLPSEVVLVVDGPVGEEIDSVIASAMNPNGSVVMRVIRFEDNKGLGQALRVAVNECANELVARMDSDDIAMPDRFEKQLRQFDQNPSLDITGGVIAEFVGSPDNVISKRIVPIADSSIRNQMKTRCPFNHMTVMFKKNAVLKAGNYQDWFWNEDYYLWIRMMESGCIFSNIPDVLVQVRVGLDMYSRRGGTKYFASEKRLQDYMLDRKIINRSCYLSNVAKRFVVQVMLPARLRGFVFRRFARS